LGENCNQLNHECEDHHLPLPHPRPHPHRHYVVNDEHRVAGMLSQKLVALERSLQALINAHHLLAQLLVALGEHFVGFL